MSIVSGMVPAVSWNMQWAAVSTHSAATRLPPQNCRSPWALTMAVIHGYSFTWTQRFLFLLFY